jgi:hypothetical protein
MFVDIYIRMSNCLCAANSLEYLNIGKHSFMHLYSFLLKGTVAKMHETRNNCLVTLKKLDLRGTSRPPALLYKRRISHADPENPRTPLPLLTKGPVTV